MSYYSQPPTRQSVYPSIPNGQPSYQAQYQTPGPQQQVWQHNQGYGYAGSSQQVQQGAPQNQVQPYQPGQLQANPGMQAQQLNNATITRRISSLPAQKLQMKREGENPVYGPLGRAREQVGRNLQSDEEITIDLDAALQAQNISSTSPYIYNPQAGAAFEAFRAVRQLPLPDGLYRELATQKTTAKMGLFEEIGRAWFVVDNKLFLWNYTDGHDFNSLDQQPDDIQAVALVKARKEILVETITHVLVICTQTKITLYGLSRSPTNEISLYGTDLFTKAPTSIRYIEGTASGRIFMLGVDKHIYELAYTNETGWLFGTSKVSINNRTAGAMYGYFGSSNTVGVESFVVDSVRNALFALHTKGEIEYIDLSGPGWMTRRKGTIAGLVGQYGLPPPPPQGPVIKIASVGRHESERVCLVGYTSNGDRFYFNLDMGTKNFRYAHARKAGQEGLAFTADTLYSSGVTFGVEQKTADPAKLHIYYPDVARVAAPLSNTGSFDSESLREYYQSITLPSHLWAIAEASSDSPASAPYYDKVVNATGKSGVVLNTLARQDEWSGRSFLVLTQTGLTTISMLRPIDALKVDLEAARDIRLQRELYGNTQVVAMAMSLASQQNLGQGDLLNYVNHIIVDGGSPSLQSSASFATAEKTIIYSNRHDALALVITRILRPIWKSRLSIQGNLAVSQNTLTNIQRRLQVVRDYVRNNPFGTPRLETPDLKLAWDAENESLSNLELLLQQAIEAISFILLLNDYKLSSIVASCDPATQTSVADLTFESLIASELAKETAKRLVTVLMDLQIRQERGIDELCAKLQESCKIFYPPGEYQRHKAEECMRKAENSARDPVEQTEALDQALQLFLRAVSSMGQEKLAEVSGRFRALQHYKGGIELPLQCALDCDPYNKAEDYDRDGRQAGDSRKSFFDNRKICYGFAVDTLKEFDDKLEQATAQGNAGPAIAKRDEAYAFAINSDDRFFHYYLYDWHVQRNMQEQLLEFDTPFIEGYLQSTRNDVEERRDLLWKFYARREDHLAAARALFELATRPSPMNLQDRSYYLAQALTSAKSAASMGADDVEFTSAVQERLDVSQVQVEVAIATDRLVDIDPDRKAELLEQLNGSLLGLDELFQHYARPYRLFEAILLIIKTADTRVEDVCEAVWRQLLQEASGTPLCDAMGETVTELLRRYFPSEAAPLDIVLPVVYGEAVHIAGQSVEGWASIALLDGGVPLRECWEVVTNAQVMAQTEEEREFYTEEAGVLADRWVSDQDAIPLADVENFASAYLLRSNAGPADERRIRTRERFSRAKAAIKKW